MAVDRDRNAPAHDSRRPVQWLIAGALLVLGLVLLAWMVTVEGEPGLIPLVMVAGGGGWLARLAVSRRRPSGGTGASP